MSTTNQGTISSQTSGAGIFITGAPFTNQGYIQAINGGSLLLNGLSNAGSILANGTSMSFTGNWSNGGTITATNATVNFGGTFTPAGIGTFIRSGGTITINGTVNNTGTTFDLSTLSPTTGSILLNVGTINGGTISGGVNAATIDLTGNGTLNGVTLATPLTVSNFSTLALVNGLTLNSTTITIASTANNTNLTAVGTQTIGGTGTIVFGGTGFDFIQPSAGGLTIGLNITIQTSSGGGTLGTAALGTTNQGTISSQTAATGIVLVGSPFTNQGYIQAINGGSLLLNGLSNTGSILANGTSMSLIGNWSNAGTITATNSAVALGGNFHSRRHRHVYPQWRHRDHQWHGQQFRNNLRSVGSSPTTGSILLSSGGVISGGTISGGVNSATIDGIGAGAGTLNGVTLTTPMTIDNNASVDLLNGLTLNNMITLFFAGNGPSLNTVGTQTIGGTGTILFGGSSSSAANSIVGPNSGMLTLGPNITIRTTTEGGIVGNSARATINQGTISSETAGAGIRVTGGAVYQSRICSGDQRRDTDTGRAEQYRLDRRRRHIDELHG